MRLENRLKCVLIVTGAENLKLIKVSEESLSEKGQTRTKTFSCV